MSEPHASPGSTGSSSPFHPAPAAPMLDEFVRVQQNLADHRIGHHEHLKAACVYDGTQMTSSQGVRSDLLERTLKSTSCAAPAIRSRCGVSAASRGVRLPSSGMLMSPIPSINTNARRLGCAVEASAWGDMACCSLLPLKNSQPRSNHDEICSDTLMEG